MDLGPRLDVHSLAHLGSVVSQDHGVWLLVVLSFIVEVVEVRFSERNRVDALLLWLAWVFFCVFLLADGRSGFGLDASRLLLIEHRRRVFEGLERFGVEFALEIGGGTEGVRVCHSWQIALLISRIHQGLHLAGFELPVGSWCR